MQNSRETFLLKEFYSRHKSIIDALAKDDEIFRVVKEVAEAGAWTRVLVSWQLRCAGTRIVF